MATPKPLTGAAAAAEYRKQVSAAGVKKAEANAKKANEKKYGYASSPKATTADSARKQNAAKLAKNAKKR
jgi:hypothetical protein